MIDERNSVCEDRVPFFLSMQGISEQSKHYCRMELKLTKWTNQVARRFMLLQGESSAGTPTLPAGTYDSDT